MAGNFSRIGSSLAGNNESRRNSFDPRLVASILGGPPNRANMRRNNQQEVCKFFIRGCCKFGDRCWNLHFTYMNFPPIPRSAPRGASSPKKKKITPKPQLCPYALKNGLCKNRKTCTYLHGDICDLCGNAALHPDDSDERKLHIQKCIKQLEKEEKMVLDPAIARSKEMTCGICFEMILDKPFREQWFGILSNCNHCFCLTCIKKWRKTAQEDEEENIVNRSCPICRVPSDFVCPSMYWVDTEKEKNKLIDEFLLVASTKKCKFFKIRRGKCPFGDSCFFEHPVRKNQKPQSPQRSDSDTDTDDEGYFRNVYFTDSDTDDYDDDDDDDDDLVRVLGYYLHPCLREFDRLKRFFPQTSHFF